MFIIIGIMLTGMLFGFLLRNKRLSWIHKIITLLIWVLLFLLGIDVGGNEAIIKGLHTLGLEALIITLAAVTGSILCAWGFRERKLFSVLGSLPILIPTQNISPQRA